MEQEVDLTSHLSPREERKYSSVTGVVTGGAVALTVTPRGQGRGKDTQGGSCLEPSGTASNPGTSQSLETEGSGGP